MNRTVLLAVGGGALLVLVVGGLVAAGTLGGAGGGPSTPSAVPVQDLDLTPSTDDSEPSTSVPTGTPTSTATPGPTATPTVRPTATATATPTPTPTPTATVIQIPSPTPTPTPDPTVPPEEFNRTEVERAVVERVNARRASQNLTRLDVDGAYGKRLQWMARNHSVAMVEEGAAVHEIDGDESADRYEAYDLFLSCQWSADSSLMNAERNRLETVGETLAGQPYPGKNGTRINENETMVADALVDNWWGTLYEERLLRPGATEIGVGVHVHWTGDVYATVVLCG